MIEPIAASTGSHGRTPPPAGSDPSPAVAIAHALRAAGTELLFGVPGGGANLDLVGAAESVGIRFVLTHTETAGAIMAATYGDITGRPGACLATRGPGATSVVNGVAQAFLDRSPLVVVTDAVGAADRRRVSRQRIAHDELFGPVTKWSTPIDGATAAGTAASAVELACSGRPGPVHLDVLAGGEPTRAPHDPPLRSSRSDVDRACQLLAHAQRPVFVLGLAARTATEELRALLAGTPWPVLTTYRAKGVVPESWPNAAGLFTGGTIERGAVESADLIVAVGLDPVELIPGEWPYAAPILAVSAWERDADYFEPTAEIFGSLAELVPALAQHLAATSGSPLAGRWRAEAEEALDVDGAGIRPQDVVRVARSGAPAGTAVTIDAGAHMLPAMTYWQAEEPNEVFISSGHATMGYALPAAIAASLTGVGRAVVCCVGDGGLGMTLAELETLGRLQLPVVVVVFDDAALSLIEIKQRTEGHGGKDAVCYGEIDFAAVASAMGVPGVRVTEPGELEAAFETAIASGAPRLLDVSVDPGVYPTMLDTVRGARGLLTAEARAGTSSALG